MAKKAVAEGFFEGTKKSKFSSKAQVMTKEQREFFEKTSKIKKETWKAMTETTQNLKDIVAQGGIVSAFKDQLTTMKDTLIASILAELNPLMENVLPAFQDFIENYLINYQEAFKQIGDMVNNLVNIKLPGGATIGEALGKILPILLTIVSYTDPIVLTGLMIAAIKTFFGTSGGDDSYRAFGGKIYAPGELLPGEGPPPSGDRESGRIGLEFI